MKEVKIPEGWELCNPSECTHAFATQCETIFPVAEREHISGASFGPITKTAWSYFGIIPVRKIPPPAPIEFVIPEIITPFISGCYMRVPESVKPGMKFRQVVEE